MATIKAIIFDVDGTLLNTDEIHFNLLKKLLLPYNINLDEAFYGKNGLDDSIYALGLNGIDIETVEEELREIYYSDAILPELRLKESALDVVKHLAKNYRIAIGSGERKDQLERYLQYFGLSHLFEFMGHGQMVPQRKSNPLYFQTIADFFQIKTENCLMVGDSPYDACAIDAGCKTVIIPSRFTKYLTFDERCDRVSSLEDILNLEYQ